MRDSFRKNINIIRTQICNFLTNIHSNVAFYFFLLIPLIDFKCETFYFMPIKPNYIKFITSIKETLMFFLFCCLFYYVDQFGNKQLNNVRLTPFEFYRHYQAFILRVQFDGVKYFFPCFFKFLFQYFSLIVFAPLQSSFQLKACLYAIELALTILRLIVVELFFLLNFRRNLAFKFDIHKIMRQIYYQSTNLNYLLFISISYISMASDENVIDMNVRFGNQSVTYFYKQGKLNQEQYNQVSSVIKSLFKVISDSQKNSVTLSETIRILKKDLAGIKHQYEAASLRQAQTNQSTEKLSRALKSAQVAYDSQRASYQNLFFEAEQLEKEVINKEQKMREDFRQAQEKMQPMMQRYNAEIQETKLFNEKTTSNIENLQKMLEQNMHKINYLKGRNKELADQEQKLREFELKIKDSPDHFAKSAENLKTEIDGMESQLTDIKDQISRKTKIFNSFQEKKNKQKQQIQKLKKERQEDFDEQQEIKTNTQEIKNNISSNRMRKDIMETQDKGNLEKQIADTTKQIKFINQRITERKKAIDKIIRNIKKEESQKIQHRQVMIENHRIIQSLTKQQTLIHNQMRSQAVEQKQIKDNIDILTNKNQTLLEKGSKTESKKKEIERQIKKRQNNLTDLRKLVNNIQKQIKDSTAVRQSMARKASVATNEVRETREQLKVKQLLILDLTKKYQETENKLQHFKALYQEVKSARNKYVNLIQNSSQDLAELKERIKILQNELQILKNESTEKNKTIQDYNHMLQLQIHKRDQTKAKLNQFDLTKRQKKQVVDQNINQIQKLNMIISSLQKDMQNLRVQYEQACENRNYTGIQLIDRNDELCILYQKSNIQENILRKSQIAVKGLEDQIRMIKIEITEMDRKIKVAREKLGHVPKLANRVLQLQQQIQNIHTHENQLSKQLEDPENTSRWRELKGDDPDEEALDAKISILEERLNSKKEQLLEKQLILDEVTNLSEKLKKDAVEGRQSTLEVSEKTKQFESRLREFARKMKATISQLSMCQANIIKYQNQKEQLQKVFESAKARMQEGLPPTPETEIQYLKMLRDKKRYEEEKRIRLQRDMMEQNLPPFATKTTAQQRVNSYIPDEIGLPKPYGNHAPFMYQQPGSNMRHFKKPKVKQIQI